MSKFSSRLWVALAAAGLIAPILPSTASAVPTFARQTGYPCEVCHFQFIPKLSSQGRKFKLGGFTEISPDRKLIEADGLSLPEMPGLSAVVKFRQLATKSTNPAGGPTVTEYEAGFYDEAALWLGGRVGSNVGAAWEWPGPAVSGKFVLLFANGDDAKAGVVLFTTDALGPFWGMEFYNTGLVSNHRPFEGRSSTPTVATAVGRGAATGMTFFYGTDSFNAQLGLFAPVTATAGEVDLANIGGKDFSGALSLAGFVGGVAPANVALPPTNLSVRANYAVMEGMAVGFYMLTGKSKSADGGLVLLTDATGFDVDYQSGPMEITFNFIANMGTKGTTVANASGATTVAIDPVTGTLAAGGAVDPLFSADPKSGMSLAAIYTVMPHLNAKFGYASTSTKPAAGGVKKDTTAVSGGLNYGIAQNVDLSLENHSVSNKDANGGKSSSSQIIILLETAW